MLWSLLKIVVFVATVAGLSLGAERLLQIDDGLRLAVAGMEFTLGPLQSVIAALVLLGLVWVLFKLVALFVATLRFLNGDETALSRFFRRGREKRGVEALVDGLTALASGDPAAAITKARKAEKLLGRAELTNLISAQAAEAQGDSAAALGYYKKLLENRKTRFVGVRGALRQKLAQGDSEKALRLAEKAFALKPHHAETQVALLELQAKHGEWSGARATLLARKRAGAIGGDVYQRRDAVLSLQLAEEEAARGRTAAAQQAAIDANRQSPGLVPAAAAAARALVAQGNERKAAKVIKAAWSQAPHPELAAAFAEIAPNETPRARLDRFGQLLSLLPDHPETRMLKAELMIAAEDFPGARRALGKLAEENPNARVLTIMAAIERGEGSADAVVRGWLTRALTASRGPQWVCDSCQNIHGKWVAVCENCGSFDTLSWREPPQGSGPSPTQTELLPLIVGQIEDRRDTAEAPANTAELEIEATEPAKP